MSSRPQHRPEHCSAGVTSSSDGTARVWDPATGDELTTFTGHTSSVLSVACTGIHDRALAVTTSSDNTARVWDIATGEQLSVLDFREIGTAARRGRRNMIIARHCGDLVSVQRAVGRFRHRCRKRVA